MCLHWKDIIWLYTRRENMCADVWHIFYGKWILSAVVRWHSGLHTQSQSSGRCIAQRDKQLSVMAVREECTEIWLKLILNGSKTQLEWCLQHKMCGKQSLVLSQKGSLAVNNVYGQILALLQWKSKNFHSTLPWAVGGNKNEETQLS